jgi:hypothetical protein
MIKIMKSHSYIPFRAPLLLSAAGLFSFVMVTLAQSTFINLPPLPNIPAYSTNVAQAPYNANPNGIITNTTAIQNAINDVSALGGGTVEIPGPGIYLTGPLTMKSQINLQIDAGAILRMLPMAGWPGSTPLLTSSSLHDVEISGSGSIDGQGGGWWPTSAGDGLYMIYFASCNTVLVQNITVSNAPKQQIVFKNSKSGNITVQNVIIRAPSSHASTPSHNTDGIDVVGTNCLIQNCDISTGDDNIALGSSTPGVPTANILVTNCIFGDGHGMSIGSNTEGGVSNLTVINCGFTNTDVGIRIKSDNSTSGGSGQGGLTQNLCYGSNYMSNIRYQPILIYSYYNEDTSPFGISPSTAAGETIGSSTFPIWQNIVISNLVATTASTGEGGMIWGRTETPATNITLTQINITAPGNFKLYNVKGLQIVDSQFKATSGGNIFTIYNAKFTITNSTLVTNVFSMDGLAGTNSLAFYNTRAAMNSTNMIGANPLTLSSSTLSNNTSLTLPTAGVVNFVLGTNNATVAVAGNLSLPSVVFNISTNGGFGANTYTLFKYTGTLGPRASLGSTPGGPYTYSLSSVGGLVNLIVTLPAPPAPTNFTAMGTNLLINLNWYAVSGATSYNLKRGIADGGPYPTVFNVLSPATNYPDALVTNAVPYYYVVTAVSGGGESTNSLQASATPLPSAMATNIVAQVSSGQLQLSWPQDHLGWQLQIQTNSLAAGLGANWVPVPNSATTNQVFIPINLTNDSVFLQLVYPPM